MRASAVAVSVLVAIPVVASYRSLPDEASLRTAVYRQVVATLGTSSGLVVDKVSVQSSGVIIELSGSGTALPASSFQQDLVDELGPDVASRSSGSDCAACQAVPTTLTFMVGKEISMPLRRNVSSPRVCSKYWSRARQPSSG